MKGLILYNTLLNLNYINCVSTFVYLCQWSRGMCAVMAVKRSVNLGQVKQGVWSYRTPKEICTNPVHWAQFALCTTFPVLCYKTKECHKIFFFFRWTLAAIARSSDASENFDLGEKCFDRTRVYARFIIFSFCHVSPTKTNCFRETGPWRLIMS